MTGTLVSDRLAGSLQALIDSRLDTIDRMLLGRVARADRLAIVKDVEAQIHDLLQERGGAEGLGRDDVLAVLARLDPPEAYLPEEDWDETAPGLRPAPPPRPAMVPSGRIGPGRVARASGIVGLVATGLVLLFPVFYLIAAAFQSVALALFLLFGVTGLTLVGGGTALVLGIRGRRGGAWGVVGMVAGSFALLAGLAGTCVLLIELASV